MVSGKKLFASLTTLTVGAIAGAALVMAPAAAFADSHETTHEGDKSCKGHDGDKSCKGHTDSGDESGDKGCDGEHGCSTGK
jgi:hypothetical protein